MNRFGFSLPDIRVALGGPIGRSYVDRLSQLECPAFTARRARRKEATGAANDPIVWQEARGINVRDVDGNVYVDLTTSFGAAAIGHAHPRVVEAITQQASRLIHALGDVNPSDKKIELLEALSKIAPFETPRIVLGLSGADAIEAALKTALLHTKKPQILAFEGAYHGLSYGALSACGYKLEFREPFRQHLNPHVTFLPYPSDGAKLDEACRFIARNSETLGAVLYEPVLGRGGVVPVCDGADERLLDAAKSASAVLIADEILTGLGRTGASFSKADLICVGKALGGGLPISACFGRAELFSAWGEPGTEALHTSTFLGNPLACASALASLDVIESEDLVGRSRSVGEKWLGQLRSRIGQHASIADVRGRGLLIGIELKPSGLALRMCEALLRRGWLVLPAGSAAQVVQLLPALSIEECILETFVDVFEDALGSLS